MQRILRFRNELVLLWRAFRAPETPMYLKVLMLAVPLYLVSPIDLVPDFIPIVGWLDDLVIVPLLVSWIVSLLPRPAPVYSRYDHRDDAGGKVIDGTARRL
jgi:uncharacterized membrane protein YkvA (DUF1232 family)